MLSFKNFKAHPLTTLGGALLGLLQAAAMSAAAVFTSPGNITDPKPYIAAAGVGAATFIIGGLLPDTTPKADLPLVPIVDTALATSEPPVVAAPVMGGEVPIVPPDVAAAAQALLVKLISDKLAPAKAPAEGIARG